MARALKKISDHLECDMCLEKYKRPKVLDCQHTFCQKCLEEYYTGRYAGQPKIPCPVCRQETILPKTRIQGLKANFHLMGIVEEVTLQQKEACSVEETSGDQSKCQKHMGEVIWFYCKTCKELICRACTVIDHCKPEHHYIDSRECKQSMQDTFSDVTKNIKRLEQALATSSQAKHQFTKNVTQSVNAVQDKADKMRAEITTQETKMIDEIKQLQQDRTRTFDEHLNTLTRTLQNKERALQTSQDIVNAASDSDILSLYPIISKDLKSLKSQNPPQIDPKLSYLSFNPGQRIGDINLGKLIEVEAFKWVRCHKFGPGGFNGAVGITATQPGEIAVADSRNNRVVICSNAGQHEGSIPLQCPLAVAAIHNPEQRLLVLERGSKYVKVFNMKDNTLVMQFPTVEQSHIDETRVDLRSIVFKNGTILVGDTKRMVWTEHRPTDGEILHTIPVKTPPYYLAVDDVTNRVVVSGGNTKEVGVADSKGTSLATIQPTMNGEPVEGRGVCCDSSGIYLAVFHGVTSTGHIHHYDLDGGFLDCLALGHFTPRGITFTLDGQLAVADNLSVTMYHKV